MAESTDADRPASSLADEISDRKDVIQRRESLVSHDSQTAKEYKNLARTFPFMLYIFIDRILLLTTDSLKIS